MNPLGKKQKTDAGNESACDHHAAAPKRPLGPTTLKEAHQWHFWQVKQMLMGQDADLDRVKRNFSGLLLSTHYSGSGAPELALNFLVAALEDICQVTLDHPIRHWSAADISKGPRDFLAAHLPDTTHIFGDQLSRLRQG